MKGDGLAKKILAVVGMIVLVLLIGVGAVAYSFFKTPAAPSGPIQAIPIVQSTVTAATAAQVATAEPSGTPVASATVAQASAVASAAQATAAQTVATATTGTQAAGAATVFEIEQASSEARFVIDEVLNGADKTVVGATDQVAGQIAVNPMAPGTAQVGAIQINARTLATDSVQRDRAIQNQILNTSKHEYITFTPTSLVGLPASATTGQSYSFQIVGQLTVAGQTKEATFAVTVTHTADGKLQGTAKTEIKYANWGISVPRVPQVASVEDTVILEIDFIAKAV